MSFNLTSMHTVDSFAYPSTSDVLVSDFQRMPWLGLSAETIYHDCTTPSSFTYDVKSSSVDKSSDTRATLWGVNQSSRTLFGWVLVSATSPNQTSCKFATFEPFRLLQNIQPTIQDDRIYRCQAGNCERKIPGSYLILSDMLGTLDCT